MSAPQPLTNQRHAAGPRQAGEPHEIDVVQSIIRTIQALVMAFVIAFILRSFLVEPFVIPTGSMAPTLRGVHYLARSPNTGFAFAVGPFDAGMGDEPDEKEVFYPVDDPLLAVRYVERHASASLGHPFSLRPDRESLDRFAPELDLSGSVRRSGDRILVFKSLFVFHDPERFDVIVFKDPTTTKRNLIKRVIGLPNESLCLIDGDIFAAPRSDGGARNGKTTPVEPYRIQRKPEHVQRAVWHPVFRSDYAPLDFSDEELQDHLPWEGEGWSLVHRRVYQTGSADAVLRLRSDRLPITDECFYNRSMPASHPARSDVSPIGDIRLAAVIRPVTSGLRSRLRFTWRAHVFEVELDSQHAELRMRAPAQTDENSPADDEGWSVLDQKAIANFASPDESTTFEFWHVDQALKVWLNDELVLSGTYDWTGTERGQFASIPYSQSEIYPQLEWEFDGASTSLHHLELDRDLYYRSERYGYNHEYGGSPALGTIFSNPAELGPDQFFACGDNSGASHDGRTWGSPEPWTAVLVDPTEGVVNRRLILGRAFFVYLPSTETLVKEDGARLVPNFGEMRIIR